MKLGQSVYDSRDRNRVGQLLNYGPHRCTVLINGERKTIWTRFVRPAARRFDTEPRQTRSEPIRITSDLHKLARANGLSLEQVEEMLAEDR